MVPVGDLPKIEVAVDRNSDPDKIWMKTPKMSCSSGKKGSVLRERVVAEIHMPRPADDQHSIRTSLQL